jgi:hypothetical protein
MMKCKTARQWLPLLEPGVVGLDDRNRVALEEHLRQCRECSEYQKEQMQLHESLSQAGEMEFSPEYLRDFSIRLNQRLNSIEKSKGWIRRWLHRLDVSPLPVLAPAAAVVWLMMVIVLQLPGVGPALLQAVGK